MENKKFNLEEVREGGLEGGEGPENGANTRVLNRKTSFQRVSKEVSVVGGVGLEEVQKGMEQERVVCNKQE